MSATPLDVLLSADEIRRGVVRLAADIRRDIPDGLHMVGVLKGGFIFLADLARAIDGPVSIDFVAASSYTAGTTPSGDPRLLTALNAPIAGKHVVVVEDIVDTGETLSRLLDHLRRQGPRSLRTACLLDKPFRRRVQVPVDYVGFTIPDAFVVGYGLDYAEQYRNLPYLAVWPTSGG